MGKSKSIVVTSDRKTAIEEKICALESGEFY